MTPKRHLTASSKRWISRVFARYDLETHQIPLIHFAAEALDRAEAAAKALCENGLTYVDRLQTVRARPEIHIEQEARSAFLELMRRVDLDQCEIEDDDEPPSKPCLAFPRS